MKQNSKETKDKIIELFYEQHMRTTDIAKELKVVNSYVTKIIQKDDRYIGEKELRGIEGKERTKAKKREHIRNKREKEEQEYQAMINQINRDNQYFSKRKEISDEQYAEWNRSAYDYDLNSIPDLFSCYNAKVQFKDWNAGYYYNVYTQNGGKASSCVKCGKCEKICPQHLGIRDLLVDVSKNFE